MERRWDRGVKGEIERKINTVGKGGGYRKDAKMKWAGLICVGGVNKCDSNALISHSVQVTRSRAT